MTSSIAIVGAGPKGVGVLERIAANAPELLGDRELVVHLVDPHPPGPGRVWRHDQSALLRMNSMAEDVTMFTDDTVTTEGPTRPGPTLAEWMDQQRGLATDPELAAELRVSHSMTFATRRLQSAYLDFFYARAVDSLPPNVSVVVHPTHATDLTGPPDGPQCLWLAGRETPLRVDHVVLALGHMDTDPTPAEQALADYAAQHDLNYLPPAYTADQDLSAIKPGETVALRGFGLAFIDLMILLTEGRGGEFRRCPDGLRYLPSGREPRLYVGSRRGVPYHAKPEYRLQAPLAAFPKFFGPAEIARLPERVDFRRDVWPLAAKEIGWGYYTELFTAHPDRVRLDFTEFADRYAELDWDSTEMTSLIDKAIPATEDQLDLAALDRPLRDREFVSQAEFSAYLTDYIEADLARRRDPEFSADLGAFMALLSVFKHIAAIVAAGRYEPRSLVSDVDGWWFGFFSYFASGPPGHRLEELLALHRAGVLSFVGPDMWVRPTGGTFLTGSPSVPGVIAATTLVEARLPAPGVSRAPDPLLRALLGRGELVEEVLSDGTATGRIVSSPADATLVDRNGDEHPRRFALGPHTSRRGAAAFTRPRTNSFSFRENDQLARRLLRTEQRTIRHPNVG